MTESIITPQAAYSKRYSRLLKWAICAIVIPAIVLVMMSALSAPPRMISIGMAILLIDVFIVPFYAVVSDRCPACKAWLRGAGPAVGGKCIYCNVQLRSWPGDLPTTDMAAQTRQIKIVSVIFAVAIAGILYLIVSQKYH